MNNGKERLSQPVTSVMRQDFAALPHNLNVWQALEKIRSEGVGEKIVYFYVVDDEGRLIGVLPTRRLLTQALDRTISEFMVGGVASIPHTDTVLDACEALIFYRLLALPVVDDEQRILGIVDVGLLTDQVFDIAEATQADALFESIGFHVSQVKEASPAKAFRYRFPWLVATISSGSVCALVASGFEATLASSIVLAFFLTLVLGLGESVSIQSMTVTIHALRSMKPTLGWYGATLYREIGTAVLLGLGCGTTVGLIVWLWRGEPVAGLSIGGSILLSLCAASFFGLSIPTVLHALKLDPKIAAGPMTLAITDIFTILFYLGLATVFLGGAGSI